MTIPDIPFDERRTMPLFMHGQVPDLKLGTLARYFEVDPGEAHTAPSDARACRGIFLKLMDRYRPLFPPEKGA